MVDEHKPERIPLPPVLLSIVPWLAATATALVGILAFPRVGTVPIVVATGAVFAITLALLARRVRRDG